MKAVLITGSSGRLGKELAKVYQNSFRPSHEELDITDKSAVFRFIAINKPDAIIHCAALTGIRQCEENRQLAWRTNVEGTGNLVEACEKHSFGCYFVYISTACVFYGNRGDYTENDLPYPKNFYSLTKLLGEFIVKYSKLRKWLIIRTNFVTREKWPYQVAFVDRWGTYLFADDLAKAVREVLEMNLTGIVHVCGDKKLSMFDLAKLTTSDVQPTTLTEHSGPPLTQDMSLKSARIKPFKISIRPQS